MSASEHGRSPTTEITLVTGERHRVEGDAKTVEQAILDAARGSIMQLAWFVRRKPGTSWPSTRGMSSRFGLPEAGEQLRSTPAGPSPAQRRAIAVAAVSATAVSSPAEQSLRARLPGARAAGSQVVAARINGAPRHLLSQHGCVRFVHPRAHEGGRSGVGQQPRCNPRAQLRQVPRGAAMLDVRCAMQRERRLVSDDRCWPALTRADAMGDRYVALWPKRKGHP